MESLVEKVYALEHLFHSVLDAAIEEQDVTKAYAQLQEYQRLRQEIRLSLFENSVVALPDVQDKRALYHLQRISSGEDLPNDFVRGLFQDQLPQEQIDVLGREMLYSWFDHFEYIQGLYEVGSLVLSAGALPETLEGLVAEMRHCFVFKQYAATYGLCRTVLEISVRHVFEANGLDDPNSENFVYVEEQIERRTGRRFQDTEAPSLAHMIGLLCILPAYKPMKTALRSIVDRANRLIHGERQVTKEDAERMLKETLQAVHDLYAAT